MCDRGGTVSFPGYLLVLARIADRDKFGSYIQALPPVYAEYGGSYLAVAPAVTVERFGLSEQPQSAVVSRWPSLGRLVEFWHSKPYRHVAALRAGTGEFTCVGVEGLEPAEIDEPIRAVVAIIGNVPTRALVEASGGTALAIARAAKVEPLEGAWTQGDLALYTFSDLAKARKMLSDFSSGQRGRSLLMPVAA
jgi:uncharacterized protein (DUF1330 family)